MKNSPPPRGNLPPLPALPPGATVSAWMAALAPGKPLSPRAAMLLLLHVSWERWQVYSAELKAQVDAARGDSPDGTASAGLVAEKKMMYRDQPVPQGEEIRALALLEAGERDRAARLAKDAFAMGLHEVEW